ncbi:MAG TPA: nicotinamide riboside transporter PnuC [Caldimonas sp.]|nr:nicotinamide riboside transporter PnuC [Caldimonas sp.]HEX4232891.1 nicotinamide riboside transporter PnuC [Caldimonas sp.]
MNAVLAAAAPLFADAIVVWGVPVTWLEVVAFVLSVAMVGCNIRVNVIGWPLAIASSLLYMLLFWNSRLYGDASLQVFFAVVAGWGWWQWLRGTDDAGHALRVRSLGAHGRVSTLVALAIAWPATALFLRRFTDTDVPWWDAFPTAASVVGQWLLGRKYVENWPLWIVVDVVGAALFAYKGLWLTTLLYLVFVVMAFTGWRSWIVRAASERARAA